MAVVLTRTSQEGEECRKSVVGVTRYVSGQISHVLESENVRDVDCQK